MKILAVLSLTFMSALSFGNIETKWEKVDTKKEVDVFKGEVKGSDIVAFKGISIIKAPINKVLSVIYDVSRIKEWMSDINNIRVLERKSVLEKIEYNRTDAPWPVSDRDFVYTVKTNVKKENKSVEILIESIEHPDAPLVDGVVRGKLHQSRYFLRSIDPESTHIEVEILADPKGSLPKWVVNLFQSSWPTNTVNGIRKIATEKDYQVHPDIIQTAAELKI